MQDPYIPPAGAIKCTDKLVSSPDEQCELRSEVTKEEAVVVLSNAVANPSAVVVEAAHTVTTVVAVLASHRLPQLTIGAVFARISRRIPAHPSGLLWTFISRLLVQHYSGLSNDKSNGERSSLSGFAPCK
jgi:uncharacterized membrane protein